MGTDILLGTQGWSCKAWVGDFYPARTPAARFLHEYARHFRAVEIDSTFYAIPRKEIVLRWRDATPEHFRFAPKFPKTISHEKVLVSVENETDVFIGTMRLFGEKLGPLVLQFPFQFTPIHSQRLAQYLARLPRDLRYAIEVRHPDWFTDAFYDLLTQHRVALVLSDYGKMPSHFPVTTDFVYIRLLGNRNDFASGQVHQLIDRVTSLSRWSNLISDFANRGVTVWGFANDIYQGHAPTTINLLLRKLESVEL